MADGKRKQALSLNQLHNRYLLDLSASQAKSKYTPVVDANTHSEGEIGGDDGFPRFDFGTPSPEQEKGDVEEHMPKVKDFSPRLFAGIADLDSPSSTSALEPHGNATEEGGISTERHPTTNESCGFTSNSPGDVKPDDIELESCRIFEKEENAPGKDSLEYNSTYPEEVRQTKVRIEGRRRLCRVSKDDDNDVGAGKTSTRDEDPLIDELFDFDSPLQMKKPNNKGGNEIRDILDDLSSKLDLLSIEKKRVPKKVDLKEDFHEPVTSKIYNAPIKEGLLETATSSNLFSSDSPEETQELKYKDTNAPQKKKNYISDVKDDDRASRNMHKYGKIDTNEHRKTHIKSGSGKEAHLPNFKREEKERYTDNYAALSKLGKEARVPNFQRKPIELSDDESNDITTLGDHLDDFTLTGSRNTYKLPGKIAKILYPHQREGLKWLWSLHCMGKGGILGDDMGLGKTMQICSFIAGLFHSNLVRRVLVVAPKTLLTHWIKELSTVGLSQKTREYFATCTKTRHYELQYVLQDKGVLLTTYDIVRNNTKSLCGDYNYNEDEDEEETWDYMILDEGHLIKNPSTQRAKSLLQIPCRHRIIISGTPLQNNLKELWALFNFCCPELLGDKKEFKDKYEHFISRGNEKNASDREKRIGSSVAKKLRDCIQPYFLRRMKSEVFGDDNTLSKKNEIIVWLRLTQCQRQLYEAFLKSEIVISAFDGSPLAAITILKKICDHPLLLTKRAAEDLLEGMDSVADKEDHRVAEKLAMHIADVALKHDIVENHDVSCKLSFLLGLLADLIPKGHNVLIFSQTRKMLNLIQESLESNDYKYMRIDGTTKASDRAKIVQEFQDGRGAPIFLLTSQVGGLGLTLTNADRVIVVDPAWNPSTDSQSVDRAYRIGQKKDVVVYRLMTCSTVEEKIYRKQVFKGGLFRSATEHKEQIRYFSQQDLKDLFSLPKQGFDVSLTQQQLLEEHDQEHTMDESLRDHVKFLETLNIAGVSQHSLLFSKAAPAQAVEIEEEVRRPRANVFMGNAPWRPSREQDVEGAQYAFNPKDVVNKVQRNPNPVVRKPSEAEIRERITRLSHIFANKAAVSKLPDKGEKLYNQISALNRQLEQMRMTQGGNKDNAIEL
ncbi:protein CHROMATIN REMODELING 24 [Andrographis paniculata]|uniref:protein CHROMATIN REMODELING 24 n=1 Tax=Andrographis paniculata TaxID=175694 RepID=UPI0021E71FAD|nr:protein CHROMATIN REMODELING 24 [Andrographis paniculata]